MTFNESYFKVLNFIKSVNILLVEQFNMYCAVSGVTDTQRGNIVKTLLNKREMFVDDNNFFYTTSPEIPLSKLTPSLEKTIWFYVKNCDKYEYCNFVPKPPANAYMFGSVDGEYKELTVFYIPVGTEKVQSRIIETNYGGMPSVVPTALLFSSIDSLENVYLSENFDIKKVAIINQKGEMQELK